MKNIAIIDDHFIDQHTQFTTLITDIKKAREAK